MKDRDFYTRYMVMLHYLGESEGDMPPTRLMGLCNVSWPSMQPLLNRGVGSGHLLEIGTKLRLSHEGRVIVDTWHQYLKLLGVTVGLSGRLRG